MASEMNPGPIEVCRWRQRVHATGRQQAGDGTQLNPPPHMLSIHMLSTNPNQERLIINNVEYIRADSISQPLAGNRAVVVVDRGWIFAGDVIREDGRIRITRAVWVFKWSGCGFAAVIDDPGKAEIRRMADIDMPAGAEIFSVPVNDQWGL